MICHSRIICHGCVNIFSLLSKSICIYIIFGLLEGLVGFGKFRLAEMKSRPSADLNFSASAMVTTIDHANIYTACPQLQTKGYGLLDSSRNTEKCWILLETAETCQKMLESAKNARQWQTALESWEHWTRFLPGT